MESLAGESNQNQNPLNNGIPSLSDIITYYPNNWIYSIPSREYDWLYDDYPLFDTVIVLDTQMQMNLQQFLAFNNPSPGSVFTGKPKGIDYWYYKYLDNSTRIMIPKYRVPALTVCFPIGN